MKQVVSVSLGSSHRDHSVEVELLGEQFRISRRGTDGSLEKAVELLRELDGKVDAIGLGGIDIYLVAGGRKYPIRDGVKLMRVPKQTPVCDGSGLKHTLEREAVRYLFREQVLRPGQKVLLVSAVDRFGMAETLVQEGARVCFGDLIFALGIPIPLYRLSTVALLARLFLPIITVLPFQWIYPTGEKQEAPCSKYQRFFDWGEVIAGDFHYIRRYLPPRMEGKIIITNTTTREDETLLRDRGVKLLITTTPVIEGRSFGTNVLEAVFLALLGKRWEEVRSEEYLDLIQRLNLKPTIRVLN
ncbi:quinate 5-dehydrogenase [Desulfothermobacter acidiphilus]|uniref:quinate 5-dehydrogenase n=1 Tax=Desulfothermobacter acidiphilus TaxID=1938353 RepID=UPI003F8AD63E